MTQSNHDRGKGLQCDKQGESVRPAEREIFDANFLVRRCLALTPEQQAFFGGEAFLT